ncbi:MAG: tyrosine--tRNA ligase [Bacilli bacterium]|nr:tyrosine--tRNA ligase [Bacilli bacterium]
MKLYDELRWRGMIQDVSSPEVEKMINEGNVTFYWGTDPTADSLHIGHYTNLVLARNFKKHGHNPILLVGGATALIGDPRGKGERPLMSKEDIAYNFNKIAAQVKGITGCEIVNNYDWIKDIDVISFLRDYGKHFTINYMLDKDKVRRQLEFGLSFTEFSYMLLQALDFKHLYETRGVTLQIAGSDQWGNITSGIELIRRTLGKEAYGMTMPLVLDENGNKIGKSEGNAVWLDKDKFSPYKMYQYLINTADSVVIDHLKKMTLLSREEIEALEVKLKETPEARDAQKALAYEVVKDIHGVEEAENAKKISEEVFTKGYSEEGMEESLIELTENMNILDLLVAVKIAPSKSEARRLVSGNGISINSEKVTDVNLLITPSMFEDKFILSKGKKTHIKVNLK